MGFPLSLRSGFLSTYKGSSILEKQTLEPLQPNSSRLNQKFQGRRSCVLQS
ncbi:uncharacterized protein M6B38_201065 [Iris pallida]|uniref:Uncharacterized protein n=1 Tax=Iris pallida TaxID=29817 RepID=A0AAX6E9C9_IRIPA|nr:uncharacterized protein M6B38_201065 [Iris pallida]